MSSKIQPNSAPYSSSASTSSTANLVPKTQKDYLSAFANLQSAYGFNGGVPLLPAKASNAAELALSSPSSTSASSVQGSNPFLPTQTSSGKNYEEAFGNLYSMYGGPGGIESLVF
ncbi:hypothetical protein BT96DRAFT_577386 [Gymnopus androsaceus JB14]|uniref:Uncharacterized protein n=1 Tax=Gymnopus androsaceus JB14 TaxID=1447944 RepID=A0A6A4HYM2_9AGAR|nr:hypothetical protein BT96DRAFT_577386 [Gymnopus androsaceus JB14]